MGEMLQFFTTFINTVCFITTPLSWILNVVFFACIFQQTYSYMQKIVTEQKKGNNELIKDERVHV